MKKTLGGKTAFLAVIVVVATFFAACSAAAPQSSGGQPAAGKGASGVPAPSGVAPAAAPKALDRAPGSSDGTLSANAPAAQGSAAASWDRMIIRTVSLSLLVKDVEAAIGAVRNVAAGAGGFVTQSSSRYDGDNQLASMTIQVPVEQFDGAVAALRQIAVKVETENGTTQDVTEEYTDLDAQVRNLQATEASLQRLMDKATKMEDIIALQRELTNVRGEIEKRQGRMKFLSRRAEMSTITVSLKPEALAKSSTQPGWRPFETARQAWEASQEMMMGIATVLIALIVFLWWLVPLGLLGWYLWRHRQSQRREGTATHGT